MYLLVVLEAPLVSSSVLGNRVKTSSLECRTFKENEKSGAVGRSGSSVVKALD